MLPSALFFQAKCYAQTLILLRDMLHVGKTSWYSIDVSGNDRHILLFYKKCHFCHLLPFAKVGQKCFEINFHTSKFSNSFTFYSKLVYIQVGTQTEKNTAQVWRQKYYLPITFICKLMDKGALFHIMNMLT